VFPVAPATTKAVGKEACKTELVRMEDAFCAMAKEKGLRAAFEHFAARPMSRSSTRTRGNSAVSPPCGSGSGPISGRIADVVRHIH